MQKISSIHLNGKAYQLEESGYEALRAYLASAEAALNDNPDKTEVLSDLEQAIGEKCAACLNANKDVVTSDEINRILRDMGPVDGTGAAPNEGAAKQTPPFTPKRLYLIREGAMFAGVCTGLAAYFNLDVTIVRVIFAVLTVATGGAWLLVYAALMFFLPYADTGEQRAAAHGTPFNAQEIVNRAKESANRAKDNATRMADENGWTRHQRVADAHRQHLEDRWKRRQARYEARAARWHAPSPFLGLLSAILAIIWIWALVSLISTHAVFGFALPVGMPLWARIIILFFVYHAITGPLRAAKWQGYAYGNYAYPGAWHAVSDALGMVFLIIAGWFVYTHVPEARAFVDHLPDMVRGWFART